VNLRLGCEFGFATLDTFVFKNGVSGGIFGIQCLHPDFHGGMVPDVASGTKAFVPMASYIDVQDPWSRSTRLEFDSDLQFDQGRQSGNFNHIPFLQQLLVSDRKRVKPRQHLTIITIGAICFSGNHISNQRRILTMTIWTNPFGLNFAFG